MARGIFGLDRRDFIKASVTALLTSATPYLAAAQSDGEKARIGVIGAGRIGSTIGGLWVKAGHPVLFS
jgi:8-hydroxy-5-deazaflavin:NADPH oxidoreductase